MGPYLNGHAQELRAREFEGEGLSPCSLVCLRDSGHRTGGQETGNGPFVQTAVTAESNLVEAIGKEGDTGGGET